nr:PREDICTED: T-complex protein 11-like protein 1 isoform X1 [Bemisia tabaci]
MHPVDTNLQAQFYEMESDESRNGNRLADQSAPSPSKEINNQERGKRVRTISASMIPGVTDASPPRFVSLEEIMKAANGMTNMALAHEIAVDKNFMLKKLEPSENSIERKVKETMHRAFWDLLSQELNADPPVYTQALALLQEIKDTLSSLLLPQHTKLKKEIEEVLDMELIRQQIDNETLDFPYYAQYITSVMGKLCAPVRDDKIRELTQTKEVVQVYKGILETLELMKLDMANFTIEMFKPHIQASSVEYEKEKFSEFLKVQADGLFSTREWLSRHVDPSKPDEPKDDILTRAYMETLCWNPDNIFPETLMMDENRFLDIQDECRQLSVTAAVLLLTISSVGCGLESHAEYKMKLKEHIKTILADVKSDSDLAAVLPNVTEQVIKDCKDFLNQIGGKQLSDDTIKALEGQIEKIANPEHKIRELVFKRVSDFLKLIISSSTATPTQVPPGLTSFQAELAQLAGRFLRLVSHNRKVFGEFYTDILNKADPSSSPPVAVQ